MHGSAGRPERVVAALGTLCLVTAVVAACSTNYPPTAAPTNRVSGTSSVASGPDSTTGQGSQSSSTTVSASRSPVRNPWQTTIHAPTYSALVTTTPTTSVATTSRRSALPTTPSTRTPLPTQTSSTTRVPPITRTPPITLTSGGGVFSPPIIICPTPCGPVG
ncbi:hypothetical protein [Catenulispora yoronensis]|uniref:hypothetical protein n=1 Tax=Catenulispora yoronensis TaxID=450799 RepID=UPI0031DF4DD2